MAFINYLGGCEIASWAPHCSQLGFWVTLLYLHFGHVIWQCCKLPLLSYMQVA